MFKSLPSTGKRDVRNPTGLASSTELKSRLRSHLVKGINWTALRTLDDEALKRELRRGAEEICRTHPDLISSAERERLADELVNETLGFGPLEPLLRDPTISDILINGVNEVYVERSGQLQPADARFDDDQHLLQMVQRIAERAGRRIDEASPMVDARLPDGSRFNAVIPPLALDGALVSIRRFANRPLTIEHLVQHGAATTGMMQFLAACVRARCNIVIAGGTGSGKTTLLNVLSTCIPDGERVVTIEDAAELQLNRRHLARMETRPPNLENAGEVTARQLLKNALRMRPDRIVIGECRGDETFDMLQAMNTGHDGSLTTIHANSCSDTISRLEMLVATAGMDLPAWSITKQIASAVNLIIHVARLSDGSRKILEIAELDGVKDGAAVLNPCFSFQQIGLGLHGGVEGRLIASQEPPRLLARCIAMGTAQHPWNWYCTGCESSD